MSILEQVHRKLLWHTCLAGPTYNSFPTLGPASGKTSLASGDLFPVTLYLETYFKEFLAQKTTMAPSAWKFPTALITSSSDHE